MEQDKLL